MREIKFRAWDKEKSMMLTSTNQYGEDEPNVVFSQSSAGAFTRLWEALVRFSESDRFELMQYTGFKDKNGKEIFEGDIITCIKFVGGKELHSSGKVLHNEPSRMFRSEFYIEELKTDKKLDGMLASDMEIIGNIYENPELLTK